MKQAILIAWTERESGWGIRPDGYSVHLTEQAALEYIQAHWDRMPQDRSPGVYIEHADKSDWKVQPISDELYAKIVSNGSGSIRLNRHPNEEYPPKAEVVYKIRRRTDGLFSLGGNYPTFNMKGKIWRQRGHLTSHLNQVRTAHRPAYDICDVVSFEIIEREVETTSIADYLAERDALARKREEDRKRRAQAAQRQADEKKLKQLAAKLGKTVV